MVIEKRSRSPRKKYNEAIEDFTNALNIIAQSPVALLHCSAAKVMTSDNDGVFEALKAIGKVLNEGPRAFCVLILIVNQKNQPIAVLGSLCEVSHVLTNRRDSVL